MKSEEMPGLRRGLSLLHYIAENPEGVSFTQVSQCLSGLAPSTSNRLLRVLQSEGYIKSQNKNYVLTTKAKEFGTSLAGSLSWKDNMNSVIKSLALESGHSASFQAMEENNFRIVSKHEVDEGFHYMKLNSTSSLFFSHSFDRVSMVCIGKEKARLFYTNKKRDHELLQSDTIALEMTGTISCNQKNEGLFRIAAPIYKGKIISKNYLGAIGITLIGSKPKAGQLKKYQKLVVEHAQQASL